jgi:hypothetical protein
MKKFLKIRMEFFYIAFFRAIGWLLSGDEMQIVRTQPVAIQAEQFSQASPKRIPRHGVAEASADRERNARNPLFARSVE